MSAKSKPKSNFSLILLNILSWFWSLYDINGVVIPYLLNSLKLSLVSSAKTKDTDFKTSTALYVISPKFPIGVDTIYSLPFSILTPLNINYSS